MTSKENAKTYRERDQEIIARLGKVKWKVRIGNTILLGVMLYIIYLVIKNYLR